MRRELLLIILFGIAVVLVISGVVLLISDHEDRKDNSSTQNELSEENVKLTIGGIFSKVETSSLEFNENPQFKIGEKLEYRGYILMGTSGALNFHDSFYVEKMERINKQDCYKIIYTNTQIFGDNSTIDIKSIAYINKNGNITQYLLQLTDENVILEDYVIFNKFYLYQPWMLALKDDLKWNIDVTIEDTKEKYSYNVIGRENFNGRECFKVERIHKTGDEIDERVVMWVDAEKRILVKSEYWFENLKGMEIEMV